MRNVVIATAVVIGWASVASALEDSKVVLARGNVLVRNNAGLTKATPGLALNEGDQVQTGDDGTVRLLLAGNAVVDLAANTSMVVTRAPSGGDKTRIKIWSGRLWARVSKLFGSADFEVESPNAVAGVRGTEFVVEVAADGSTDINVLEGAVAVNSRDGGRQQLLGVGDQLGARAGTKDFTTAKSSESERRILRGMSSAGGHLGTGATARLGVVASHLPMATGTTRNRPRISDKLAIPPLDIDPAAGRIRLRGVLNILQ
ncbi:MAG: FecR domain-containing protein [Clostridia bacterium]|nr:FecR domain-containing protein [Deltaproteobacteria bacterium]